MLGDARCGAYNDTIGGPICRGGFMDSMSFVSATYRLSCSAAEAPYIAQQIALEQSVEVPEELLDCPRIRAEMVGRVRSVAPSEMASGRFDASIDYPVALAGTHAGQLWNLLYGNVSLKLSARLQRVELPSEFAQTLPGPRFGIAGLRKLLGVTGRPLLATALKPRGSTPERFAELAAGFALGGGDLVKDDHNLVDDSFAAFQHRIELCQAAVERATQQTGLPTLYAPNLSPPAGELDRYAEFLLQRGIRAALIAPLLLGLDTTRYLTSKYPLVWLAHPSFTGSFFHHPDHGIAPNVLLGQCFRWLGCDATIFPNAGGRFTLSAADCAEIADAARRPEHGFRPSWPVPAGGMSYDRLPEMAERFGAEAIFLIGGALLADSANLTASTARFLERIETLFPQGRRQPPTEEVVLSACELPVNGHRAELLERLAFRAGYAWDGRSTTAYKTNGALPFRDVARTELIGQHGEQTAFDVRYFEIGPGGHSSLEWHVHTHVVIGLRGAGMLTSGDERLAVNPLDIAYVPPLRVHQLRNDGTEPFGFLCIVDHERDKPRAP
jgi:ribulose-bisphosphate carboxylase large chain